MGRPKTLRERMEGRLARRSGEDVFLTREFLDLGGEDQVLRALRGMVRDNQLIRLGYGVYGRAEISSLSGKPILNSRGGFVGAARQALTKLGVAWEATEAERDYNAGRSTQVPVNPVVRIKGRFSRRLRDGQRELVLVPLSQRRGSSSRSKTILGFPSPALVEKDWHVVRALAAIHSAKRGPTRLVFGGGTALSRAHGLTQRMSGGHRSEDRGRTTAVTARPAAPAR